MRLRPSGFELNALSQGVEGDMFPPIRVAPRLGLQLMRQGYHLDMGSPLSASRFADSGNLSNHSSPGMGPVLRGIRYNFLLSSGG